MLLCGITLVLALIVSSCTNQRSGGEDRLVMHWMGVHDQFDALVAFELEFRTAAAAAGGQEEADRLRFVREALDRRYQLQLGLKRELREFTAAAASASRSTRMRYLTKLRLEVEKLKAVEAGTVPAVKALALDRYEDELTAYQIQRDAEFRSAR